MLHPELFENADDDTPDVVASAVGGRQRADQKLQGELSIARVERLERGLKVGASRGI